MKLAIIGSRDYNYLDIVKQFVKMIPKDTIIVSGGARGVDKIAEITAKEIGLNTLIIKPLWHKNGIYDKSAGMKRNIFIINECDKLIAFWNGKSKGTKNSIENAKKQNKLLAVIINNNII